MPGDAMTKAQLLELRAHHERIRDMYAGSDFEKTQAEAIEVIDLAIRALDQANDARLGAAVRKALGTLSTDPDRCDRIASDAFDGRVWETDRKGFAHMMRIVAKALREDAGE